MRKLIKQLKRLRRHRSDRWVGMERLEDRLLLSGDSLHVEALQSTSSNTGEIIGHMFEDTNGDSHRDVGETLFPGISVYIDSDGDGHHDPDEPVTQSDGSGQYRFSNLANGTYTVSTEAPVGLDLTSPTFPANQTGENVVMLSNVQRGEFAGSNSAANDVWGYVSPSGREYALIGLRRGMGVVEVTNPRDPSVIAFIPGPDEPGGVPAPERVARHACHDECVETPGEGSTWRDVKVFGEYAYNVNETSGGMQVLDLTQVDQGTVTIAGVTTTSGLQTSHNITINTDSGYAYLTGSNIANGGLVVFDLNADPVNPPLVGVWNGRYFHDVDVISYTSGPMAGKEIAYGFAERDGVYVVDVTDKSAMTLLATRTYPNVRYAHYGAVSEDLKYLFVNDELDELQDGDVTTTTTYIFDIQDPANPVYHSSFTNGKVSIDHNLRVRGDYLYEANYRTGLRVFDITDIDHVHEVGHYDTYPSADGNSFDGAWGVYTDLPSGVILVSDMQSGLFVLEHRPPADEHAHPIPRSTSNDGGSLVSGSYPDEGFWTVQIDAGETIDNVDFGFQRVDFHVHDTEPANTADSTSFPYTLTLNFHHPIDVATVDASDLSIAGESATGVRLIDDDSVQFTLPQLTPGLHPYSLAAGGLTNYLGTPNDTYVGTINLLPPDPASISGVVWNDADLDTVRDHDEVGAGDVVVFLDTDGDGLVGLNETTVTTAPDGSFTFNDAPFGTYNVAVVLPTGHWIHSVTNADEHTVTVDAGDSITGIGFNIGRAVNVAAGGLASQSSTILDAAADLAIDGNTDGVFTHGSVAVTQRNPNAWWEVDLQGYHWIDHVDVWNRTGVDDALKLAAFNVFVSDVPFQSDDPRLLSLDRNVLAIPVTSTPEDLIHVPVEASGRFVRIQIDATNYLSIAEVEVFAHPNHRPVTIDDTLTTSIDTPLVIQSADLLANDSDADGSVPTIVHVHSPRHGQVSITAGTITYSPMTAFQGTDSFTYTITDGLSPPVSGRVFVDVGQRSFERNLAIGATASQSATILGAVASRAIDGDTDGDFAQGSVTATRMMDQPWWQVDLGGSKWIDRVRVWNRTDGSSQRLSDYRVFVSSDPFASDDPNVIPNQAGVMTITQTEVAGIPTMMDVNRTGRFVRVQLLGNSVLSLAEVQVIGSVLHNDPPLATNDTLHVSMNQSADVPVDELIANDVDPDNTSIGLIAIDDQSTKGGTISLRDGVVTYSPPVGFVGLDSFTYQIADVDDAVATGTVWVSVGLTNLAIGESTRQTSTIVSAGSERAVDGNTDGAFAQGSVTATRNQTNAFWEVDLGDMSRIDLVKLWNRTDAAGDRLQNVSLFVSPAPFKFDDLARTRNQSGVTEVHVAGPVGEVHVSALQTLGRYVRVQLGGTDYLSLAEVQVFGTPITAGHDNVATSGIATQSSNLTFSGTADRAVDGNTDGDFRNDSVTATNRDLRAWWELDLGYVHDISLINIWNRTDAALERLADFDVFVSVNSFSTTDLLTTRADPDVHQIHVSGTAERLTPLAIGQPGRYIRVQLNGRDYLSLAEVEVFSPTSGPVITHADVLSVAVNEAVTLSHEVLLANDIEPSGGALTITSFGDPDSGTVVDNQDGTFTYTPATGFVGVDTLTYTVNDSQVGHVDVQVGLTNVALNRSTSQSSTLIGHSSVAVDGNVSGVFADGSVTATRLETNPWWEVDLGDSYQVAGIELWNRIDSATQRLSNVEVFVSESMFVSSAIRDVRTQPGVSRFVIDGQVGRMVRVPISQSARYVRVQLADTNYLSLAEVRVLAIG